jgi:hypothetical protein
MSGEEEDLNEDEEENVIKVGGAVGVGGIKPANQIELLLPQEKSNALMI